jgi:hypothetical protein
MQKLYCANCTGNGIPDECETDCNGNGVADACDLAAATSPDCQGNADLDHNVGLQQLVSYGWIR